MKKERSCSGGMFEFPPSSPNLSRRSHKDRHNASTSTTRLRHNLHMHANAANVAQLVDLTIFHIPGLDVKVNEFISFRHFFNPTLLLLLYTVKITYCKLVIF